MKIDLSERTPTVANIATYTLLIVYCAVLIAVRGDRLMEKWIANRAYLLTLAYFDAPTALPGDPRLERSIELFADLTATDIDTFEPYFSRLNGIKERLNTPLYRQYVLGRNHLRIAQREMSKNRLDAAIKHLSLASASGTKQVSLESTLLFAELLERQGDEATQEGITNALAQFSPEIILGSSLCNDLDLLGVYIDELDVELNRPIHVVLLWKNSFLDLAEPEKWSVNAKGVDGWKLFSFEGDLVFQVGQVDNLVPDGAFEGTILPRSAPLSQFPTRLFTNQRASQTYLGYSSTDSRDYSLSLHLVTEDSPVGLGSPLFPANEVGENSALLVSGWYRSSATASPRVGIKWWPSETRGWDHAPAIYLTSEVAAGPGEFAELVTLPADADIAQLWIMNRSLVPSLFEVDDITLLPVPLPCTPRVNANFP